VINASVSGVRNPNARLALYSAFGRRGDLAGALGSDWARAATRADQCNFTGPGCHRHDAAQASAISRVAAGPPLERMGQPEEVAEAVTWLLSDASSYVVGHVLAADGGFLAS
jgi:NAD(P)-dependent dehydrogenase (short-subunit alcohol dehydrogenase family)